MTGIEWTPILVALIGAGLLKYAADLFKWLRTRKQANTPAALRQADIATVDLSLAVVARARDELEADNVRLRSQLAETDARHAAEMARRDLREKAMREEITVLENKLRALLAEVEKLKDRHLYDDLAERQHRQTPGFPGPLQHP